MKSSLKAVVGIAATVFFLWWALREVTWTEVAANLRGANWLLLGAAVLVSTLGMHVRALRWKPLLQPVAPDIPFRPRIAGVCIGFGANNVFPARLGEFARTWVLAREARIPLTAAFASLVLERALDGVVMLTLLLGSMAMPGFPDVTGGGVDVRGTVRVIALVTVVLLAIILAMALFPGRTVGVAERVANAVLPEAFRRPLVDALHAFVGGLHVLRSPRLLAVSVAWAFFQWFFLATSFLLAFRAFGITEPGFLGAVFLQSVIALAVSIPAAPGFFGVWEAASVWGLGLWGVDASRAVSFAIGLHLGGWFTVTALGMYYAARINVRWRDLGRSEERVEEAVESDPSLDPGARPA
ncbi:MAG TPA: lysylphosphatidylglycerol synthase transmembrane domain-containing protein [Longimicrobium sp.]|nr:lysylphosphatidylglycerol synthase transmembrane domain-containing protein [Longimicrobium sp.]